MKPKWMTKAEEMNQFAASGCGRRESTLRARSWTGFKYPRPGER
jgi:hypothetical protein